MVRLIPSSVFVKDPKDVWGKETTIGLAEHAARLGSPMTYDRRGDIIWYEDFSSVPKFSLDGVGEKYRVASYREKGDFSLCMVTPSNTIQYVSLTAVVENPIATTSIGFESAFSKHDDHNDILFSVSVYDGTNSYTAAMKIYVSNKRLQYLDKDFAYQDVASDIELEDDWNDVPVFYHLKFVFNLSTRKYVRCLLANNEYDLSDYPLYTTTSATPPSMHLEIKKRSNTGVALRSYIDSMLLTRNEPE